MKKTCARGSQMEITWIPIGGDLTFWRGLDYSQLSLIPLVWAQSLILSVNNPSHSFEVSSSHNTRRKQIRFVLTHIQRNQTLKKGFAFMTNSNRKFYLGKYAMSQTRNTAIFFLVTCSQDPINNNSFSLSTALPLMVSFLGLFTIQN